MTSNEEMQSTSYKPLFQTRFGVRPLPSRLSPLYALNTTPLSRPLVKPQGLCESTGRVIISRGEAGRGVYFTLKMCRAVSAILSLFYTVHRYVHVSAATRLETALYGLPLGYMLFTTR